MRIRFFVLGSNSMLNGSEKGVMTEITYIRRPHYATNLLHGIQIWAQSTMHCKDLLVNDGRNGQAIEAVRKSLPKLDVVPSLTLIIEPVYAVD